MKRIILFLGLIFISQYLFCQNITVQAKVDTQRILIGDWVKLSIRSQHSSDLKLYWPDIENSLGKFEVVKRDTIPIIQEVNGQVSEQIDAIISAYDSGYFQIPSIKFLFSSKGDTTNKKEILTEPINMSVNSLAVDTTAEIKDIKEPIGLPFPIWLILLYIGIALLIIIIGYIIWNKIKNRPVIPLFDKTEVKLPAHEIAFKELSQLEEQKLWQRGMVKEYYSGVTDIIRRYIHNRYDIDALEMTTDEILQTIINIQADDKIQEILKMFLNLADFVKFAKFQPVPNENEIEFKRAFSFVDATKEKVQLFEEPNEQNKSKDKQ